MAALTQGSVKDVVEAQAKPPQRRRKPARIIKQMVPDEILHNEALNKAIEVLNQNYEFEVGLLAWRYDSPYCYWQ